MHFTKTLQSAILKLREGWFGVKNVDDLKKLIRQNVFNMDGQRVVMAIL